MLDSFDVMLYAMVLAADQASPIAPELDDEKVPGSKQAKPQDEGSVAMRSASCLHDADP